MQIPRRMAARDDTNRVCGVGPGYGRDKARGVEDGTNSVVAQLLMTCHSEEQCDEESAF